MRFSWLSGQDEQRITCQHARPYRAQRDLKSRDIRIHFDRTGASQEAKDSPVERVKLATREALSVDASISAETICVARDSLFANDLGPLRHAFRVALFTC